MILGLLTMILVSLLAGSATEADIEVLAINEIDQNQIIILNASAIASGGVIRYSAIFANNISTSSSFDAITRLDTDERVIALKSERLTLQPGESIIVSGMFSIPGSGEYVVQWEALTPPPGAPLASRTRLEVEASEGVGIITVTATIILVVAIVAIMISYRYRARVWKRFQSNSIRQPG